MAEIQSGGGPAFPTNPGRDSPDGMSLRDYFAAKAMQTLTYQMLVLSTFPGSSSQDPRTGAEKTVEWSELDDWSGMDVPADIAGQAYAIADAMLTERGKK